MKKFFTMLLVTIMLFVTACTYQPQQEPTMQEEPYHVEEIPISDDGATSTDVINSTENIHNVPVMASIVGEYALWTIGEYERHFTVQLGSIEFTELLVIEDDWYIGDTHWKYMVDTSDVEQGLTAFLVHADIAEAFLLKVAEVYHLPEDEVRLFIEDAREEMQDEVCIFFAIAI